MNMQIFALFRNLFRLRFPSLSIDRLRDIGESRIGSLAPILLTTFLAVPTIMFDLTLGRFLSLRFGRLLENLNWRLFRVAKLASQILGWLAGILFLIGGLGWIFFVAPLMVWHLIYVVLFSEFGESMSSIPPRLEYMIRQFFPLIFYSFVVGFLRAFLFVFVSRNIGEGREFYTRENLSRVETLLKSFRYEINRRRPHRARRIIREAIRLYEIPPLGDRIWLQLSHAKLWIETASVEILLDRPSEAAQAYVNAEHLYEGRVLGGSARVVAEHCDLYKSTSAVMKYLEKPHA